jgi:hypothetical protein
MDKAAQVHLQAAAGSTGWPCRKNAGLRDVSAARREIGNRVAWSIRCAAVQDFEAGSSRRGTVVDRGEECPDDERKARGGEYGSGVIPVDNADRVGRLRRGMMGTCNADGAIAVLSSVIVVMGGLHEDGKQNEAYTEE